MEQQTTFLGFSSNYYLPDYIKQSKPSKKIVIFPNNMEWNFASLSVFLNQLDNFALVDHSYRTKNSEKGLKAKFHFQTFYPNPQKEDGAIFIDISENSIKVKGNLSYLSSEWSIYICDMNSNIGSQNSPKKTYKKQKHMCFMKNFSLCPSSQALFDDKSLLFFSKEDFSEIFNFFVYHFKKFDFCKIDDKLNLHDYYLSNFSNEEKALNSFADLENNNLKGCIKLTLEKSCKLTKLKRMNST